MKKEFKILLATDYSEAAMNAEYYAVQFAKNTNSSITCMHVYDIPFNFPAQPKEYSKAADELRKRELQRLEQHMDGIFHSLNIKSSELKCECIIREGAVSKQIHKEVKASKIDFIVVGTHGAGGFRKFFLGSHTWDVIGKSAIPVLAIPKDAIFSDLKHIVFATEYREGEVSGMRFLVQVAKQFNAGLTVLHISNNAFSKQFETNMFEGFKKDVLNKVDYPKLNLKLIHSTSIIEGLNNFCTQAKADWIVMSPERSFFLDKIFNPVKSVTKEMTFHTHIPLFTIPDFYAEGDTALHGQASGKKKETVGRI